MFDNNDERYLLRQLGNNQVVLFLGAGFSFDAQNLNGKNIPTGWTLGEQIWKFLNYSGEYDGTALPEMYQAFINKGVSRDLKTEFLDKNLLSSTIPEFYNQITSPFWFKVYTTNIDDVLDKTFKRVNKQIEILKYPKDQFSERDQSLEKTQIVYLHGKLPCNPEEVIFSQQQYAKSQLNHEPLYAQFVYDYSTLPTIFIGTDLNEPLFERYIAAREARFGLSERRPKSFLITPDLSPVKAENLRSNYNVHYIQGTTKDFLEWLKSKQAELPERIDILKRTFPNLLSISEYALISDIPNKSINEFAKTFNRVPKEFSVLKERSGFLMGTSPRWNDIFRDLDIPRTITSDILKRIEVLFESEFSKNNRTNVFCLHGYAGSGKSTIIKRLGVSLSQQGRTVFLSYSDYVPKNEEILDVVSTIDDSVVLMFDNAKNVARQLPNLIKSFNTELTKTPLIILSVRSNYKDQIQNSLTPDIVDFSMIQIPNLDDEEIDNLIKKLDDNNLLGVLNGMNSHQRKQEFKNRAHRQLLVAMKEATNGKSFNEIIRDEYETISPFEARMIALCIALNTELGFTNSKQDIVGFSNESQNVTLNYLETVLSGTIIGVGSKNDRLMLRHKILADYIIKNCASSEDLKQAYIRVLSVLAPELVQSKGPSTLFNLYKALINHRQLYRRFKSEIDLARDVYDSITDYFKSDYHFWLQYGSLEMEGKGGDLLLAENYILQAESLSPYSNYVKTAKCNLLYVQAHAAVDKESAAQFKQQADDLAHELILTIGKDENIIYHIYCAGRYKYLTKWIVDKKEKKEELESLENSIKTAINYHPFSNNLKLINDAIKRAYIQLGVQSDLEDPTLPEYL